MLQTFLKWTIVGSKTELKPEFRTNMTVSNISAICDIILASIKSSNQTQYTPTPVIENERGTYSHVETPFTVAFG